jgi:hypothetical protein
MILNTKAQSKTKCYSLPLCAFVFNMNFLPDFKHKGTK